MVKERLVYGTKTACYGLVNSCEFVVNKLKENDIDAALIQVPDHNSIDKVVHHYKPTHCFIEALWVTPEKFKILAKLHPHIHWIVRIHSMIPFLVTEGMCFDWMNEYMKLQKNGVKISISCNNHKLHKDLNTIYKTVSYTPNIYYPKHNEIVSTLNIEQKEHIINVGCFGALRILKNHAQQALWAIELAEAKKKILHFHVNISEYETDETNPVLKNLRDIFENTNHKIIEHTWMTHVDFIELVKLMDFGLQISFTETFNIVAADFVHNKVPVIVSSEIDFVDPSLTVNPSNPESVLEAMNFCLQKDRISRVANSNLNLLKKYNEESLKIWLSYLNHLVD